MRSFVCAAAVFFAGLSTTAANTEPPAWYDSRSAAMGGVGVASATNASALFHNPAELDTVSKLDVVASVTPYLTILTAPFTSDGSTIRERDSGAIFAPFSMLGLAYRVHDRIVLGAGAFFTVAGGGSYDNVPELGGSDLFAGAFGVESHLAASLRITEELQLGVSYRLVYARQELDIVTPSPMGFLPVKGKLAGVDPFALQAGLTFRPLDSLSLGFGYRSKVKADLDGDQTVAGVTMDADGDYLQPDAMKVGAAFQATDCLLVAMDLKYWLYSKSHQDLNWRDAFGVSTGAEYVLTETIPLRAGYYIGQSATRGAVANPFSPAPGLQHVVTLGAGYKLSHWRFDAALAYGRNGKHVSNAPIPGAYRGENFIFSLTANFHL